MTFRIILARRFSSAASSSQFVEQSLARVLDAPAVVVTKESCSFCHGLLSMLAEIDSPVERIELLKHEEGPDLQVALGDAHGQRTVPMLFVGGKLVGGYSDAKALHDGGLLGGMMLGASERE
jgi:glutaredoxin